MRDGCPFCDYSGPSPIIANFVDVIVFEPMEPVTAGHLLVVPVFHCVGLEMPWVFARVAQVAAMVAGAGACNVIASVGREATQTVPHLHVHVVPRRHGDGLVLPWGLAAHEHEPQPQPGTAEYAEYVEHVRRGG